MPAGCDWYAQTLAKAEAASGPMPGLSLIRPDGSAQAMPITFVNSPYVPVIPNKNESTKWTMLWKIVAVTETHVFLLADAQQKGQLLVVMSTTPGEPATVIDTDLLWVPSAQQVGVVGEVPGWLYYTQHLPEIGAEWRLRRVSLTDPTSPPETVAEGSESYHSFWPSTVLLAGDDTYVNGGKQIMRLRKGKSPQSLGTVGPWFLDSTTGIAVIGDRLLYSFQNGSSTGDLVSVAIKDDGLSMMVSQKISAPGIMTTVLDGAGNPAIGLVAYGGLVTIPTTTPVPAPAPIAVVWKGQDPHVRNLRLDHLEYGTSGGEPGYFVDVACGPQDVYAPAFVTTKGEMKLRASEPGFPFVQPMPWANSAVSRVQRLFRNQSGFYVLRD